jgi:hypothetical protein
LSSSIRAATEAEQKFFGNDFVMANDQGLALFGVVNPNPPPPPPDNGAEQFLATIHAVPGLGALPPKSFPVENRNFPVAHKFYELNRLFGPDFWPQVWQAVMTGKQPDSEQCCASPCSTSSTARARPTLWPQLGEITLMDTTPIDKLNADPQHLADYFDKTRPGHKYAVAQRKAVYEQVYGTEPVELVSDPQFDNIVTRIMTGARG